MNKKWYYFHPEYRAWRECSALTALLCRKIGWRVAKGKENA